MTYEIEEGGDIPPELLKLRIDWPFHRMQVGQKVIITRHEDWKHACRAAYVTASRKGFTFRTKWNKLYRDAEGRSKPQGTIWRVS